MTMKRIFVFAIVLVTVAACGGVVSYPTPPEATAAPTTMAGATASPVPATGAEATATSAPQPTMAPTAVVTGTVVPSGNLTDNQMALILGESFSAYPWQLDFTVENLSTNTTISGTLEAQSPTQVQATLSEPIETMPAMVDIIVISPTLYLKVSGLPDSVLSVIGLKADEWGQLNAAQDTLGVANLALAVANPAELLAGIGYENLLNGANTSATPFELVGTEQVAGVTANVYQSQVTAAGATTTYKVVIGVDDSRVYRMESQGPLQTTSTTVTYLSSLNIQAPIP